MQKISFFYSVGFEGAGEQSVAGNSRSDARGDGPVQDSLNEDDRVVLIARTIITLIFIFDIIPLLLRCRYL